MPKDTTNTAAASKRRNRAPARRQFVIDSARLLCGVSLLGLGLFGYARQAKAKTPLALRPPGAHSEDTFLAACIRCGLCVRDCPYHILELAKPGVPVATGTPYFTARRGPCEMCEDLPCVKACPTGALDHALTRVNDSRMGLAVLSDQETCLNFLGLRCDVCYRVCPVIDKAITLDLRPNPRTGHHAMFIPTVHSDHCTGCGKCENACVTDEASIRVLPRPLVKGSLASHYRLGWEEKAKTGGRSLIEERNIIDLPDRLPEGMRLEGHFDPGSPPKVPGLTPGSVGRTAPDARPPPAAGIPPDGNPISSQWKP